MHYYERGDDDYTEAQQHRQGSQSTGEIALREPIQDGISDENRQ